MNDIYNVTFKIERIAGPSGKAIFGSHLYELELSTKDSDDQISWAIAMALAGIDQTAKHA